ncbi:glycoside hydrolase family protein [Echinicola strongylocentroti]|uniref:glycoside hydrolase family protein n=1 Tax=Echinicola strongylocentroti TaxID=1795355 RepID=UPI001B878D8E|nr:glycoside hydrolase family protein [Echinicola strongylocentroti]
MDSKITIIPIKVLMGAIILLAYGCGQSDGKLKQKAPDFEIKLGKIAAHSSFSSDTASIWGGSLVKGEDGLYHMMYSFWPKNIGWEWVNYSQIGHAVSESPFGPFEHREVALPDRGENYWDGSCTHNPTVYKIGEKYYLYYMGNKGDKEIVSTPGKPKINWVHRNNQRIGVAVADSPNGPWKRLDQPVLDIASDSTAHDALMTSNPSVCQMEDGRILMVYKTVGKKEPLPGGGPVVHMVAIADSPTGPFKKYPDPVFTFEGERFPAEDPYIWFQDGKYRAIVKRIKFKGSERLFSLVHYDSEDGIKWEKGKYFEVSDRTVTWEDGSTTKLDHLERPQLFMEKGEPVALLCAADTIDANNVRHSFNVQLPLSIVKHAP